MCSNIYGIKKNISVVINSHMIFHHRVVLVNVVDKGTKVKLVARLV